MKAKSWIWAALVWGMGLAWGGDKVTAADFVAAIDGSSSIYYAASNGDGTFSDYRKLDYLAGWYSDGLVIADFDNDGDLDIIAGRGGGSAFYYLFLNNGSNAFTKTAMVGTMSNANGHAMDMAAGDFNNDGNQDFIANGNSGSFAIFLGNGKGTFAKTEMDLGSYGRGMDVADFNNDGNLDFARATYYNSGTYVYPGNGDGTFGTAIYLATTGPDPYGLVAGDFNNDGRIDLIVNEGGGGDPYFFAGNGDFTFAAPVYQASLDFNNHGGYDGYDFNNDGNLDVVASSYTSYLLRYYPGNGDGSFGAPVEIGSTADWCMGIAAPPLKPAVGSPLASITPATATIAKGGSVNFDGSASSDPDGSITAYTWSFGDGGSDSVANPGPHTYANEGLYSARLLVTDNASPAQAGARLAPVTVQGGAPAVDTTPVIFGEAAADDGLWSLNLDGADYASDAEGLVSYDWLLRDNLTLLFEAAPDTGWSRYAGTWLINDTAPLTGLGSYQQTNEGLDRTWNLYNRVFSGDLTIEADVHLVSGWGEEAQLVFRAQNEQNSYHMILRGRGENDVLLYRRINGSDTSLGEYNLPDTVFSGASYPVDLGHTYHLKVVCRGSVIELHLDGRLLFVTEDSTFSQGRVGFSSYYTNVLFDNLTVTTMATGQSVSHAYPYKATPYSVRLTVADAAGQTVAGNIPMTMQRGAAPVAEAGGPYTVGEEAASGGGWTLTLDGSASGDDVEIRKYIWDFGIDLFTGTTLPTGKWLTNNGLGIAQNDAVAVTGASDWANRYLVTRALYPRVKGQIFEATVNAAWGGNCMFGFKNDSSSNFHYGQFPYAIYLSWGTIYIYEDGNSRGSTALGYSNGVNYDFQIELTDVGAIYRYRPTGTADWTEIYRSAYVTGYTQLRKGITVNDSTFTIDNFRETTAGANPPVTLFNGAASVTATLTVYDRANQTGTDTATLTTTVGEPPVANAGADQTLGEGDASHGQWTGNFDATASTDDFDIYLYEWDWNYDGVTFVPSGDTGPNPSHTWEAPGTYTVAVRITDHALQTRIDTMTVIVTQGNPPTALAGGPYVVDENTGNAFEGGFTVTLNGGGSTDPESSVQEYVWNLGTDTFNGTVLREGKWYHSAAGVSQNEQATIAGTGNWGIRYLFSKDIYPRADGLAFEAKVRSSNGSAMVGFKNTSTTDFGYWTMPYALYFAGGGLQIYEDGGYRASVGNYSYDTWYDVRIELKRSNGARYYYRVSGDPEWILLYDSASGWATEFRRGVDVHSGAFDLDDLKEIAGGVSPSYRFYGLGLRTVTLTVADQAGQKDSANANVRTKANAAPVPVAGPDQTRDEADAFFGTWEFAFDGSSSTDDHGIFTYEWDWDYDGTFDPSADKTAAASHIYNTTGVHTVALRVTDHALQSVIDTATVTITTGEPPVAEAGADQTTEGLWPVIFNAGGSTDDMGILKYEWDFGDGGTGVGKTPSHTYWAPGVYTATLTVYDRAFQTDTDTVTITVLEAEEVPVADAGGPYTAGAAGPPAYFNASASTDDYGIIKFLWDVDITVDSDSDGTADNDLDVIGRKPFFTYGTAGNYTAKLTVVDGAGQTATATALVNVADNLAPDVICVPWRAGDPTIPHETYNGRAVTLKAIVRDSGELTYQWNFGDGSAPWPASPAAVTNKYAIEATHTYPDSPDGTPFTATLRVCDSNDLCGEDQYYVVVRPDSLDTRTNIAIDEGLWYTHKNQNKTWGYFGEYWGYYSSPAASAVQSFEINGHLQTGDNQENPYVETVDRGLGYLFTTLTPVALNEASYKTHGNPDTNGNGIGIGVNSDRPIYEGGMAMDAIASSGTPLGLAITGGASVKGRYFHEILTDMVDMYAYGQVDSGYYEGGWRYGWHWDADNSACQWAAIGLLAAEDTFGINVPQFVKDENDKWLTQSYDGTGFGYGGPGNGVATTPSGMVQLAFSDKFTNDPRWRTAEDYIANNWFWQNNNYYGVYALVKALKLARPYPVETLSATGLDWYNDPNTGVRARLISQQTGDGSWQSWGYGGRGLDTSWAVIMLTPTLFVQPPVADAGDDIIWAYGMELRFDASGSFHTDSTRHIVKYEWDFNGDGVYDLTTTDPADPAAVYTYVDPNPEQAGDAPQVITARLRVTDDNEPPQTDIDTRELTVAEPPHAPFARPGGPYKATVGIPFILDGGRSFDIDAGDSITTYQWDLDNDGVWFDNFEIDTSNPTASHTYNTPGVYSIGLRVWDRGAFNPIGCTPGVDCTPSVSDPQFTTVTVEANLPPVAAAGGPYTVGEGTDLILDGSGSSDPNGDPLTYEWDLDNDGQFDDATGVSPTRRFNNNGEYTIGLRVSDSLLSATATTTVVVNNVAPTVEAGNEQTANEGAVVSFNGSFTDPGSGDTHAKRWTFGDGTPAVTGTLTPTHVFVENGTYTVTLRVTDNDGGVGTDTLTVTVNNNAPVVNAGPDQSANEGATVSFSGSFTDAGVFDTHTTSWNFGDGSAVVTDALTPSHMYIENGTYTVTLTVTDDDGGVGSDALTVTVNNVAPVVNAGPDQTVNEGATVSFNGSFTDVGAVDTHNRSWNFGDGSPAVIGSLTPTHVYADNGTYTVTLTVTDDDGGAGSDTLTVTVNNVAPVVNAGPDQSVNEGATVNFSGSFTDAGPVDTHVKRWTFGDGTPAVTGTLTPTHVFADNGTYTVTLRVTDDDGGVHSDTLLVTVRNVTPVVNAGPDQTVNEGASVSFSGSFTDAGTVDTQGTSWNFGDGSLAVIGALTPTHVYADNGTYTVTLTVTDDDGGVGSDTLIVTVNNVAPMPNAGPDQSVNEGATVSFDGSFTDGGAADTHGKRWTFGDGTPAVTGTLKPAHIYAENGTYTVTLRVTDDDGGIGTDTMIVTVRNVAPVVNAGPDQSVNEGATVSFSGSFTDAGTKDTQTKRWTFGDGTPAVTGTLAPTHVYADNGTYTVTLRVTDDDGGIGTDTLKVTVNNVAPVVNAGPDQSVDVGAVVNFTGSFTDPGADTHTTAWTFGDGGTATATLTPGHAFASSGTYTVTLSVTDKDGGVGTDSLLVEVKDTSRPTGSILINNGGIWTASTDVTLDLQAEDTGGSGIKSMRFRNGGEAVWSAWEPYQTTKAWTLTGGAGPKTVFVLFKDKAGNISDADPVKAGVQAYRDRINYDPLAPTGSIRINDGADSTATTSVTLNLLAVDTGGSGVKSMRFRNGGEDAWSAWEPFQTTRAWTLTGGAGPKTVLVQFKDKAGNISDAKPATAGNQGYQDRIVLEP